MLCYVETISDKNSWAAGAELQSAHRLRSPPPQGAAVIQRRLAVPEVSARNLSTACSREPAAPVRFHFKFFYYTFIQRSDVTTQLSRELDAFKWDLQRRGAFKSEALRFVSFHGTFPRSPAPVRTVSPELMNSV